jgi:hypothetical protein
MTRLNENLDLLQGLNPVPQTGARTWAQTAAGQRIFAEIESRAGRSGDAPPGPTRPRWRRPTITIPVVAALTASALLFASAIAGDKTVQVRAEDALRDPEAVEKQLASEGIQARIQVVPVNEARVGKWVNVYADPGIQMDEATFALHSIYRGEVMTHPVAAQLCSGEVCKLKPLLELPGGISDPITLVVGRTSQPDEAYWANIDQGNLLAPTGPLYCYQLEEKSPQEAEALLRRLEYDVVWVHEGPGVGAPPPTDAQITWAWFRDPDTIDVRTATAEDADQYRLEERTPTEKHPRSSAPRASHC